MSNAKFLKMSKIRIFKISQFPKGRKSPAQSMHLRRQCMASIAQENDVDRMRGTVLPTTRPTHLQKE